MYCCSVVVVFSCPWHLHLFLPCKLNVLCFFAVGTPIQEKKPRGRPPRVPTSQKAAAILPSSIPSPTQSQLEGIERPAEKVKRLPGRPPGSGEKRRGRPPSTGSRKLWSTGSHAAGEDSRQPGTELGAVTEDNEDRKCIKRMPLAQPHDSAANLSKGGRGESKATNLKRLKVTKLSPLKSRLKTLPGVPRRRRGRPPSAERLKAEAAAAAAAAAQLSTSVECGDGKHKAFRVRGGERGTVLHNAQQSVVGIVDGDENPDTASPPASPSPSKLGRTMGLRKSPRHRKPVRIVPSSKRTDATIAKQLLQRAKKGAQKRLEKEASGGSGTGATEAGIRKTQLKNIRQFIMPVVSTVSLRIIKTPKRFIEDEGSFGTPQPHLKMPRLETSSSVSTPAQPTSTTSSSPSPVLTSSTPAITNTGTIAPMDSLPPPLPPAPVPTVSSTAASLLNSNTTSAANGRFSSSAASCGSSAVSQHSSQLSSAESSRSSSPSLDDSSCDSQVSEATQALSEAEDHSPSSPGERDGNLLHSSRPPSPPSEPEPEHVPERSRRGRRGQGVSRGTQRVRERLPTGGKKPIISPATGVLMPSTLVNSQQASSTASSPSSPPPPPLLAPPQPPQSVSSNTAAVSEHHSQSSWMPHPIPPFLPGPSVLSSLQDKRSRSILREPTFRWTSPTHPEQQYFSSAKYAKEGLIRKPIFDNFRPPPLTAEDVGLLPQSGAGGAAPVAFPAPGSGAGTGTRLFAPLHSHTHHQHASSRFDAPLQKRSPLLRAPRFTPSEAHSRIFESVTLHSSSGSSPGSLSPHQTSSSSNRTSRRRRRLDSGAVRGHPRSPSHSMTTRSSQFGGQVSGGKGSSEMSGLMGSVSSSNPSSLPGGSASPLATSALTAPFSTFPSVSLGLASQGTTDSRRGPAGNTPSLSTTSSASSPLFPLFPSSHDMGRGGGKGGKDKCLAASQEPAPKEKERVSEKNRDKEKENKKEGRKDQEKRSKVSTPDGSSNPPSSLFTVDGKDSEDALLPLAPKKTPGRKKSTSVDTVSDTASSEVRGPQSAVPVSTTKERVSKKGRPSAEKAVEMDDGDKEKEKQSSPSQHTANLSGQPGRQQLPASSLGSVLAQAEKQPVTDKRVVGLLKKAKAQLFEIKKSKLKPADQTKVQVSCYIHMLTSLFCNYCQYRSAHLFITLNI